MTRWQRISDELHAQRKSWKGLAIAIGASTASVGNWKSKGVPPKHFLAVDKYLNKGAGWTEAGDEFVALVQTVERIDRGWPFSLVNVDDYESLPLPLQHKVQVLLQQLITKEIEVLQTKQQASQEKRKSA